jgi:hypothetical protein
MTRLLTASAVLLVLASSSVAAQDSNGCVNISSNHDSSLFDVPFVPTGTPLLSRFGFALNHGDNHIQQILIFPGLPPGMMRLDFSDEDPTGIFSNDDYCFNVTHFDIVDTRIRQVTRGLDICDAGNCTVQLDKPAGDFVFVLIGFQFSFRATDHHIKEVSILENSGLLTVGYHDEHFDAPEDTFIWSIQYAYVPADRFSQVDLISGTRAHDRVIGSIPVGGAVLRGFKFIYQPYFTSGGDHHLQQIGVRPNRTGTAFITYRDENGDDGFDWEYRWAILKTFRGFPGDPPIGPVIGSEVIKDQSPNPSQSK